MQVATPYGPSPSFRLCRLTDRRIGPVDGLPLRLDARHRPGEPVGRAGEQRAGQRARLRRPRSRRRPPRHRRQQHRRRRRGPRSLGPRRRGRRPRPLGRRATPGVAGTHPLPGAPVPRGSAGSRSTPPSAACRAWQPWPATACAPRSSRTPSTSTPPAPGSRPRPRTGSTGGSGLDLVGKTAGPEFRLARMYGMCLGILSIVVNPAEGLGEFEHGDLRSIYRRCGPAMARMVIEALADAAAEPDQRRRLSLRRRSQRIAVPGVRPSRPLWRRRSHG